VGQFPVTVLVVQVPRRFASIASRTRLQDNFRVADHPGASEFGSS